MTCTILYPDAIVPDTPDIETAVFADLGNLAVYRTSATVPEALWRAVDAIVCYDASIGADVVQRLHRCRIVVRAGVGFDQIDLEACRKAGIPVCNTPDYGTTDVADHTVGLMLALARSIVSYDRGLAQSMVDGWAATRVREPIRLAGRVLGVIGLGRIGMAVALRAKALGMSVVFHDPFVSTGVELNMGLGRTPHLDALVETADVISLHTPLTADTRNLIDGRRLERMKPGAMLINTSRGPVVDTRALMEALRTGRLAAAALDVLPTEPPEADDPLITAWTDDADLRDRLILTPHIAFRSCESLIDLRRKSAETARDYLRDGLLRNCVNGLSEAGLFKRKVSSTRPSEVRPDT